MLEVRKKLGEQIRKLRNSAELTQEELGEKAGLSYKYVGEVERGQVNVSLDSLGKIARALGVNIRELFCKDKDSIKKISAKDKGSKLSGLSKKERQEIRKAIKILNKLF